mmetsp:Transcript_3784/g.6663  ORF Transcript_3784/g.6663 Transcript_3784/m.6663 type:complete len:571 (-) Transcript_3784:533-2245(-)
MQLAPVPRASPARLVFHLPAVLVIGSVVTLLALSNSAAPASSPLSLQAVSHVTTARSTGVLSWADFATWNLPGEGLASEPVGPAPAERPESHVRGTNHVDPGSVQLVGPFPYVALASAALLSALVFMVTNPSHPVAMAAVMGDRSDTSLRATGKAGSSDPKDPNCIIVEGMAVCELPAVDPDSVPIEYTEDIETKTVSEPELNCTVVEGNAICELPSDDAEMVGIQYKESSKTTVKGVPAEAQPLLGAGLDDSTASALVLKWLFLISPFFMWGTSMVAMKATMANTTPLFVAGFRCVPAGLLILAFAYSQGKDLMPKSAKAWAWVFAFSLVDATAFQGFLAEGLRRTSAGLGSVIIDSQPLTVAILASIFFGETLGTKGIVGLFLGVLGISLVEISEETFSNLLYGASEYADISLWDRGEWWMLLAAQSMALGTIMVRLFAKEVDPVVATGWHLFLGGLPLLAASVLTDDVPEAGQDAFLTAFDWLNLSYVSVFGGAVGYGVFFYLAQRGSLTQLSSLTFLTPMFAVLGGYAALGESLTPMQGLGAAVTITAIYLINAPKPKEASDKGSA